MNRADVRQPMSKLAVLLSGLSALVAAAATSERASAQRMCQQQEAVDSALGCIALAAEAPGGDPTDGPHLRVVDASPDVVWADVDRAFLPHGRPLDVFVDVRASAQLGGLLLSFGNVAVQSSTWLRVAGRVGATEVFLVSGTSLANLAAALNSVGGTRFLAFASGTAVELDTVDFGASSFVSVRVLEVGRELPGAGIYRMMPHAFGVPDASSRIAFTSFAAAHGVVDFGRDVRVNVNGWPALSDGPVVAARSPFLRANFELTTGEAIGAANAQTLGVFRAFRVERR